jgi:D-hydroxyproline dehydrogenase subunit beta
MSDLYDVVVVGAGIVGLAHAWVASRRGLRVAVVERDTQCMGASVRNFGFVTVTGQGQGDTWRRARRSRDIWEQLAPAAGIRVEHRGLWVMARRHESAAVLEAFARTEMGERCELYKPAEAAALAPELRTEAAIALLYSPHELRVESRQAIPKLARWLERDIGVDFIWGEEVLDVSPPLVSTARRSLQGERVVICTGADWRGVASRCLGQDPLRLTNLQMMRVRAQEGFHLGSAVMSDLSLVRYRGYAELPESAALLKVLQEEQAQALEHGVHLIAVQGSDGSLVVGDSHHGGDDASPFAQAEVEDCILTELRAVLNLESLRVVERWMGAYPVDARSDVRIEAPDEQLRAVVVTSGTGASTAFALAEDVFDSW